MFTDDQIRIAETFLGTAVNSGLLNESVKEEMIRKIRCEDEVLLPISHVEKRLGVSRMTVYRMIERGELKAGKSGGSRRVTKSSLDRHISSVLSTQL